MYCLIFGCFLLIFHYIGMDTTAHTLAFMIYCLAKYPEVQKKCQDEVDTFLGGIGKEAATGTLPQYVEAALKESMRKFPTAAPGSIREVRNPKGYDLTPTINVPCGWSIQVNLLCLHTNEDSWGADAAEFKPERFLDLAIDSRDRSVSIDPLDVVHHGATANSMGPAGQEKTNAHLASPAAFAGAGHNHSELCFAPFSYGLRHCIGMNLALMELRVTLLSLISNFHFELADKTMLDEDEMLETVFLMRPKRGLPVIVTNRAAGQHVDALGSNADP
jgi:cytochrome P450